jgi:hypothetical protein
MGLISPWALQEWKTWARSLRTTLAPSGRVSTLVIAQA